MSEVMASTHAPDPINFEHYKILIDDARALGDRRETINNIFVGIATLALGAQGYLFINSAPKDLGSTLLIIGIGLFGWRIIDVWRRVLVSYRVLLNFRYEVLKHWEENFPPDQRYYTSEDILYEQDTNKLKKESAPPLVAVYLDSKLYDQKRHRKPHFFVDIYRAIPNITGFAFIAVIFIRLVFILGFYLSLNHWISF